jgi:formylglycine-generating enzyme required for sulfatase activity
MVGEMLMVDRTAFSVQVSSYRFTFTIPNHHPMATTARYIAPLAMVPLFAFTGNKPEVSELPKSYRDMFAAIPAGVLRTDAGEERIEHFMISTMEVSNAEYLAFVADVKAQGDQELLSRVLPDTSQWLQASAFNEPFKEHYFRHPAYADHPVVNVGREGVLAYCQWLQEKLNKEAGKGAPYEVRLPMRNEWRHAANGGLQHAVYAWGGPNLRNAKGCALANFRQVGGENVRRDPATGRAEVVDKPLTYNYVGVAGALADNMDVTTPVHAYAPNAFGLYNMNGNVAEMLAEPGQAAGGSWRSPGYDVRNESVMAFNGPSPEVGFRVVVVR